MMAKANWEKLIESYINLPEPINRAFLIPLPFTDVDSACSTYTEVAEWNDAWGVNVRTHSEPDKHRIRYTLDIYDDEPQHGPLYFMLPTKSLGEITIRQISDDRTELSIKATGLNDKLVTMVATTFLKNWMDERQSSQYWAKIEDEQMAASQQPIDITINKVETMNEIELILQEKADVFVNFLKTHTVAFLDTCTNEWVWKIWGEYGDHTVSFKDFKRNLLGNKKSKYTYNGLSTPGPSIIEAEEFKFSLIGWRGLGPSEVKILLVFTIIPTTQRIQIVGRCDPDAETLYRYLLEQITKVYPDASSAAAPPQPIGINISNISSTGNVNINLSNVAGRDQISATSLSVSPTYQDLLQDGIKFLKSLSYDKAVDKLRKATELEDAETEVHYYLAIALLKGRSFNSSSLHPKTRNEIEKHLKHAHTGNPDWLPPFVLLAVMEIEYHSLHGTPNKNVVVDEVAKRVKQQGLSPEESQLLRSCNLKERTKQRLHLTF